MTVDPMLNRCPNTEQREGKARVRCVRRIGHDPALGCVHRGILFTEGRDEAIRVANEEPVCGRSWTTNGMDVREHWNEPWRPLVETIGHVCYETKGHAPGEHVCWCGETAREKKAA